MKTVQTATKTAGGGSPPSTPPMREIGEAQLRLLCAFALADLLGLSPAARQRMAAAAATEAANAAITAVNTTETIPTSCADAASPSTVESVMVCAVLEHVRAATTASPLLTSSSSTLVPSALEAAPWESLAVVTEIISATPSTQTTPAPSSSSPAPSVATSLLPPVLSTHDGVARVDALHPTFVLQLLTVLLRAGCGMEDRPTAVPPTVIPASGNPATTGDDATRAAYRSAFLQLLQLYAPRLLNRHGDVCAAVGELYTLVSTKAVSAASAEDESSTAAQHTLLAGCLRRSFLHGPTPQWLEALVAFVADAVDVLSTQSRKAARSEARSGDADGVAPKTAAAGVAGAAEKKTPVKPPAGGSAAVDAERRQGGPASTPAATAAEMEEAEAVWMLTTLGMFLSFTNPSSVADTTVTDGAADVQTRMATTASAAPLLNAAESREAATPVSTDAAHPEASLSPVSNHTMTASTSLSAHRSRSTTESIALAVVVCRVCRRLLFQTPLNTPPSASSSLESAMSLLRDLFASSESDPSPRGEVHGDSTSAWSKSVDEPLRTYADLLAQQRREKETQRHRLLAAAERAVQRVLRLPSMPWHSAAMLVALCNVTSYQLDTQLRQRRQRWREVEAAAQEENPLSSLAAASDAPADVPTFTSPPSPDKEGSDQPTAPVVSFGEAVWSETDVAEDNGEEEEQTTVQDDAAHDAPAPSPSLRDYTAPVATATMPPATQQKRTSPPREPHSPLPLRLYTPRASSLSRSALPPTDKEAADGDSSADSGTSDPLVHLSDPVRLFSATRSMEHLWELPMRVPRAWTPALASVMACCSLCIPPTSTVAAQRCLLVGEPLPESKPTFSAVGTAPSSVPSSTRASPRPSLLDFGFARRRDAAVESSGSGSNARASVLRVPATVAGATADGVVIGALAQWHLRGLIQQLCLPSDGMQRITRVGPAAHGGMTAGESCAVGEINAILPAGLRSATATVPSSAGAAGGASWFAAYTQANRASSSARTPSSRGGPPQGQARSTGTTESRATSALVVCQLSPVLLLASCAALQHLLRTHASFFLHAQLGGTTMRELRSGVMAARRTGGGTAGWLAGMLQCTPAPLAAPSPRSGNTQDSLAIAQGLRGRSLWTDVRVTGQGGDRSATAVLDAGLRDDDNDDYVDEEEGAHDATTATSDGSGGHAAPAGISLHSRRTPTKDAVMAREGDDVSSASANTCVLTEAMLVAVSFLGSRVVAVALPQLQTPDSLVESNVNAPLHRPSSSSLSWMQWQWCDALQALAGLLLDAHRVHRSRHAMQAHQEEQRLQQELTNVHLPNAVAPADRSVGHTTAAAMAWRAVSVGSTREGSVGSHDAHTAPSPPTTARATPVQPPSLSTEAQFGIGTFFLALVRALLQLHSSNVAASLVNENAEHPHVSPSTAELVLAQCVFAIASVIDDLLHDYAQRPPAALCDVLAMMTVLQLPCTTASVKGDDSPTATGSPSQNVWEALQLSPYWDMARFGALESASQVWSTAPESTPSHSAPRRRRSSSTLSDSVASPRDGLLGFIPCSRDPALLPWLPPSMSLSSFVDQDRATCTRSWLELMAEEEALVLATQPLSVPGTVVSDARPRDDAADAGEAEPDEETPQLVIAVAASQRYAWWASRLQADWAAALLESVFSV